MSTVTFPPLTAADVDLFYGDKFQDRFNASQYRTVISVTDARPGRVWILYTDGTNMIEDITDLPLHGEAA